MEQLNGELVTRCLNFHGQQLQKIWEAERGDADLAKHNIKDLDFMEYAQRQKHLSFQDRGKRLKLHQFVVKKADFLFGPNVLDNIPHSETQTTEDVYAIMCPFETFLTVDKQSRLRYFFEHVKIGDLILGTIVSRTTSGMMLKVLCTSGSTVRYVADINVKAFCPVANIIPAVDRKGVSRSYMMNDSVCCEVLEVIPDTDKMVCGMKGSTRQPGEPEPRPALGLISAEDFPLEYKKALDNKGESYDAVLEKSVGFNNPNNIAYLSKQMGIGVEPCTLMTGLKGRFPEQEYSNELRQVQASKWAFRSVADGIDHFKAGRHTEAFQCLNKALTIDPKNVEGLVARGALYANSGNFQKAIEDFETALKLNPSHANARKYMGETLVALGRSYEDENKLEEARKAYQSCLTIIPFHEEAQNSLDFLKSKTAAPKNLIEPGELLLPTLTTNNKPFEAKDNLMKQLMKPEDPEKKDKKKKKKSKKRKNRHHSSSSSSSSSSGSSHSSSSSSTSSSESSSGSSDSEFKKRKKRRHRREKQRSLSPLSKRMAMMDPTHDTSTNYQFNKPNASFQFGFEQSTEPSKSNEDTEYEIKVRNFLEQTKGDSDYEEKVRKFLEETARWKKDKKSYEKKKKKKRDKKAKKESKRKRKKEKLRHKDFDLHDLEEQLESKKLRDVLKKEFGVKDKHKRRNVNSDIADYLLEKAGLLDGVTDFDDLETKLRDYYALEKECKRSDRSESEDASNKRSLMDSPSPTREQKARQAVAEATASAGGSGAGKWKMQIGSVQGGSRFKKRPEREEWNDERHSERGDEKQKSAPPLPAEEKAISVRKAMALKEPLPKKDSMSDQIKMTKTSKPTPLKQPIIQPGQVVLDKFGSFRLLSPSAKKMPDDELPPLPPGAPPKSSYSSGGRGNKPPEPPGRPRSMSRSPKRKSRSRSRGKYSRASSRSSSASRSRRSRSRSYRSRSRSYYSRSRSRSGSRSYYSRSRSRSRSYSGDRRRVDRRGGFRGRYNDRGTYYKPRFQTYKNNRGYNRGGGRGGYGRDGRDFRDHRDFRGRGRGRNYNYNNRRPRGRFRGGGYRDFRDRSRYDRASRDDSRDRSRSISRDHDDAMKKVNEEKEKINKYLDNGDGSGDGRDHGRDRDSRDSRDHSRGEVRHEGPLSEGEDRDDYSSDKFVDRQSFDGKWADGKESHADGGEDKDRSPCGDNFEQMNRFLDAANKERRREMLERNKDTFKSKPW